MYVIINGNRYEVPEVGFDAICELEERGVNLLAMDKNKPQLATTIRGIVAWIMGIDTQTASREIEAHIANGGDIIDVVTRVSEAVKKSGFFSHNRPQDHRGKGGKVKQYQRNGNRPQNRDQRRANNKNHRNGNRSLK